MDRTDAEIKFNEIIGVAGFYIGKAFKLRSFYFEEITERFCLVTEQDKLVTIKLQECEDFFDNFQEVFPSHKPKAEVAIHKEEEAVSPAIEQEQGEHTEDGDEEDAHILSDEELREFDQDAPSKATPRPVKIKTTKTFTSPEDVKITINDINNILIRNIQIVQEDSDYIEQANTINNSVNTLINLAKLSISMMKKNDNS